MLVSPTEQHPAIRGLGQYSSKPEKNGVDIMFYVPGEGKGWAGVQRKEVKDFVASVQDGRLSREVAQMQGLFAKLLVIEGNMRWTIDGEWMDGFNSSWTQAQHQGILWSIQQKGIWVSGSATPQDTATTCILFERWLRKGHHRSLDTRPGPYSAWGQPTNADFQRHMVTGLPGIGPELADRIVAEVGMPFTWKISKEELMKVRGMGKKKVEAVWKCLEGDDGSS